MCMCCAVAENMHHIIAIFTHKQRVPALSPFVSQARERYDQNLAAYIRLVLRRPLARPLVSAVGPSLDGGRFFEPAGEKRGAYTLFTPVQTRAQDYFAGLEQLLRTMPPTEVSLHSAYTRSALRRVTSELRAKDLRKAIDALYKRVDKHFGGEVSNQAVGHTDVLKTVWKACEEEMVRLMTAWKGLIAKCYPVSQIFAEHQLGSRNQRVVGTSENLRWRRDTDCCSSETPGRKERQYRGRQAGPPHLVLQRPELFVDQLSETGGSLLYIVIHEKL